MAIVDAKRLNIAVDILEDYCEVFDNKEYDLLSENEKTLHVAHFTDTDDYTWLTIGYDVNDGRFFVYCNHNINPKGAYQYAAERMTEVEVFNIEL